jgi:hypothetical protein
METQIAKAVREFRKALAERSSTFFLVYTDVDVRTNQILTKVTSNSTPEGISAILGLLLEPTEKAIAFLEDCIADGCSAEKRHELAQQMGNEFCKLLTIKGIEPTKALGIQS